MTETRYMHSLKVSPSKYLLITKGKILFPLENLDKDHLKVIHVNITSKIYQVHPDLTH